MSDQTQPSKGDQAAEFEQQARRVAKASSSPLSEFWYFLVRTRKWWMVPILLSLFVAGALIVMSGTALAPLIYTLF
jgi:hypothetical protein